MAEEAGGAPEAHASSARRGADFRDAVAATLEAACRGLVWEHKHILACREANLRLEIERLQQELSAVRTDNDTDCVKAKLSNEDASTSDGACNRQAPYPSVSLRCFSTWLSSDSNDCLSNEVNGCMGKVCVGKAAQADQRYSARKLSADETVDHDTTDWSAADPARNSERRPSSSSMLAMVQSAPDGQENGEEKEAGMLRVSHRSLISTVSSPSGTENRASWRRAADSVIVKAGSEFFCDCNSVNSMKFNSNMAALSRIRKDRTYQIRMVETLIGIVIVLNTMTLGMSSELNPQWVGWLIIDCGFAGIFTLELIWKFGILGLKGYCWGPEWRWNDFEFILVVLAWIEVGSVASAPDNAAAGSSKSSLFRMLRLMRLAKLLRILRLQIFCDLLMMVNGAIGSWKTLLYSGVLIFIPLYGVALVLKETLGVYADTGNGAEGFKHLEEAFFTLFRCHVAGDCNQEDGKPIFVMVTRAYGWSFGLLYCLVQFLMTFGLFNVIVAIYVENTVSAAKFNDTFVKRQRLRDREYFEEKAQELVKIIWRYHVEVHSLADTEHFDEDAANKLELTQGFFEKLCKRSEFTDLLRDLDISEEDQLDLFETLDVEGAGSIDLMDFVIGIGKLRGEARKADVIAVNLLLRAMQHKLLQMESRISSASRKSRKTRCLSDDAVVTEPSQLTVDQELSLADPVKSLSLKEEVIMM